MPFAKCKNRKFQNEWQRYGQLKMRAKNQQRAANILAISLHMSQVQEKGVQRLSHAHNIIRVHHHNSTRSLRTRRKHSIQCILLLQIGSDIVCFPLLASSSSSSMSNNDMTAHQCNVCFKQMLSVCACLNVCRWGCARHSIKILMRFILVARIYYAPWQYACVLCGSIGQFIRQILLSPWQWHLLQHCMFCISIYICPLMPTTNIVRLNSRFLPLRNCVPFVKCRCRANSMTTHTTNCTATLHTALGTMKIADERTESSGF